MPRPTLLPAAPFEIASFAELVSDPSRVRMLLALMDGSSRPASELAQVAGVARSTASVHLQRLLAGGLLATEPRGRHRYFRLASDAIADALETLALVRVDSAHQASAARPLRPEQRELSAARTCYRHLAGQLGVAVFEALQQRHLVHLHAGALALTEDGEQWLTALGAGRSTWPRGKPCLDWTERKNHLGGPLGVALTEQLFALRWIARRGDGRALRVTTRGALAFARELGIREGPRS